MFMGLIVFWCCLSQAKAFWGLFGGSKEKSIQDQRLEELQKLDFQFKPKRNFQVKTISPSSLVQRGRDGMYWNQQWKKESVNLDWQRSSDHRRNADGVIKKAKGFHKDWSSSSKNFEAENFSKRFGAENQVNRWDERRLVIDANERAKGYDRQLSLKEYRGKESEKIKQSMQEVSNLLNSAKDLPDRPLTVAEVRDLLNRGRVKESTREAADAEVRRALPVR
jgi:hypothetical protein